MSTKKDRIAQNGTHLALLHELCHLSLPNSMLATNTPYKTIYGALQPMPLSLVSATRFIADDWEVRKDREVNGYLNLLKSLETAINL